MSLSCEYQFATNSLAATEIEGDGENFPLPAGADVGDVDPDTLQDIDFDDGISFTRVSCVRMV